MRTELKFDINKADVGVMKRYCEYHGLRIDTETAGANALADALNQYYTQFKRLYVCDVCGGHSTSIADACPFCGTEGLQDDGCVGIDDPPVDIPVGVARRLHSEMGSQLSRLPPTLKAVRRALESALDEMERYTDPRRFLVGRKHREKARQREMDMLKQRHEAERQRDAI